MFVGHLVVVGVRNLDGMTQPCCYDMGRKALVDQLRPFQQNHILMRNVKFDEASGQVRELARCVFMVEPLPR